MFKKKPIYLFSFDVEDDGKGNPKIFNFYDGFEHFTFYTREEVIDWLVELSHNFRGRVQFWSCNLSYDFAHVFNGYFRLTTLCYVSSRVIFAKINGTKFVFYDTLNHWKMSVKKMGERISLPKLDHGGNFINLKYCKRDCEIVWWFVLQMNVVYESFGAEIRATIGSTALDVYKKSVGVLKFKFGLTQKQIEWMLKGYYGGRTEVFFTNPVKGCIQYFDFNSLYPSTMLEEFPDPYSLKFTKKFNLENEGMADVTIQAPDLHIPFLPTRHDEKLIFPTGQFRGIYTYVELRHALKIGYEIIRVHRALETKSKFRPYKDFILKFYNLRRESQKKSDELMSEGFKLIMNNLYGKMAQGNEITELIPMEMAPSHSEIFGDMALHKKVGEYPDQTNVIWPAYVTSYGRIKLWDALMHAHNNGALVLYADTDSIIFESDKVLFSDSKELGELKCEGVYKYGHFKSPKMYRLVSDTETYTKVKGVPRSVAETFFDRGVVTFRRPYRLREVLRRNASKSQKKLVINYWDEFTKEFKSKYDKRLVLPDGSTKPLRLGRFKPKGSKSSKGTAFAETEGT